MICAHCGKKFQASRPCQKYCSRKCHARASSRRQNDRLTASRRAKRGKFVCVVCGAEFTAKNTLAKYCSKRCASTADRRRHGIGVEHTRTCPTCGKTFTTISRAQKFCSTACGDRDKYIRRTKRLNAPSALHPSAEKVRAYLAQPPDERWARRRELTKEELALAEKIYNEDHATRVTSCNFLAH